MDKTQLREQWEKACNDYMKELLRVWELDAFYAYWVGGDVGGVLDYDGVFSISIEEIIFCVENDVTEDQYEEWQNYNCDAAEFGFSTPNLKSWMKGCPRTPPEVFARLRAMKKDLADAVEEEKLRQGKPSPFI
jgi:hypothetical protein